MAITNIAALHTTAVVAPGATTEFTTSGRGFWLHSSGLLKGEKVTLYGLDSNGAYRAVTNKESTLGISAYPNSAFIDLPPGTYRLGKGITAEVPYIGYEEE